MAMANIPVLKVGSLIGSIGKLAHSIAIKVEDVKTHKRQCSRLSERINRVAQYVDSHQFKKAAYSNGGVLQKTLKSFDTFLQECLTYVSSFVDMGWIQKFIHSREHKEHFQELNQQLELYFSELTMGINIKNLINRRQDRQDRIDDSNHLFTTIKTQKSLFQIQDEQIHQLEKLILNKIDQLKSPKLKPNNLPPMKDRSTVPGMQDIGFILSSDLHDNSPVSLSNNTFANGTWSLRYSQSGVWHGPFKQKLTFNSNNGTLQGKGENDVGQFTLRGNLSKNSNRIDISQKYKYGTGNPRLNAGHQCQYQLTWNEDKHMFEGTNYMPNGFTMTPVGKIEMTLSEAA